MKISDTGQKTLYFLATLSVALALGPSLAHLFELPNKIGLPRDDYFTVQNIYRGWALLGFVVFAALSSTLFLIASLRQRRARIWAAVALSCIVGTQILFWTFTYPANEATTNWTQMTDDWRQLRAQWEYSHAAAAVLNVTAMVSLIASMLSWKGPSGDNAEARRSVDRASLEPRCDGGREIDVRETGGSQRM